MINPIKKFAAAAVVAALLISCLSVGGSAIYGAPIGTEAMNISVALSASEVEPGDIVTVTVSASDNYNAIAMRWPVLYSKDFFELVTVGGVPAITTPIDTATAAAGSTTVGEDEEFIPAAYSADDYGVLAIQWIADAQDGVVGAFSSATAVPCFTFGLRVKADAAGTGSVFIPSDSDKFYYSGILDAEDAYTSYTSDTPFSFTFSAPQTASVASAQSEPVLTAADGFSVQTMIFDDDETVYLVGFDVSEIIDNGGDFRDQFVVQNGTYEVSDDIFATGVEVTVYDSKGDVYAVYPIIFFGDVDGTGEIDANDVSALASVANYEFEPEGAFLYACDVMVIDGSETYADVDANDLSSLISIANYEAEISMISQLHQAG